MNTLMVAPLMLETLMMLSPFPSIPAWSMGWTLGGVHLSPVVLVIQCGDASDGGVILVLCLSSRLE
jgi:hypothetical protein